jgi:hypothetical protein
LGNSLNDLEVLGVAVPALFLDQRLVLVAADADRYEPGSTALLTHPTQDGPEASPHFWSVRQQAHRLVQIDRAQFSQLAPDKDAKRCLVARCDAKQQRRRTMMQPTASLKRRATTSARPGRPRSATANEAILNATGDAVRRAGIRGMSVDAQLI